MFKNISAIICFFCFLYSQDDLIDPVFTGAFGSATINDQIYNQFSIRPEFAFSKVAVGLDIYFYFDENGDLYNKNWDFSSSRKTFQSIVDKIYYIRWGQPTDDMYFRVGSLPTITLGNSSLISSYSNSTDYPRVRRTGFNFKKRINKYTLEIVHSNLKNIFEPAVFAINNTFNLSKELKLNVVAIADLNQNKGLIDTDSDGIPDYLEPDYADNKDQWFEEQFFIEENSLCQDQNSLGWIDNIGSEVGGSCINGSSDGTENTFEECNAVEGTWEPGNPSGNDINDFCDYTVSQGYRDLIVDYNMLNTKDPITGISLGASYDILNNIYIYTEFSQLFGDTRNPYSEDTSFDAKLGYGFIPIGFKGDWDNVSVSLDFRGNSKNFIFNYWDRNYDHSRISVQTRQDEFGNINSSLITKESELYNYGKSDGMYFNITSNLLKFINISMSYQHLNTSLWNNDLDDGVGGYQTDSNKSLYAKIDVDTSMIDKVRIAEVFYQKSNVQDIFKSGNDENSLFGYNLGLQMADNMVFILKGRKTYAQNEFGVYEPVKTTQIESQILF